MRGFDENMNGRLRQYVPKSTDLSVHTVADLASMHQLLSTRPREVLGWATPATVFTAKITC
jgi:IS30 family transposase